MGERGQQLKKIYLSKKEIVEYDDRECHLFCDTNFNEFSKKLVLLVYAFDKFDNVCELYRCSVTYSVYRVVGGAQRH